MCWNTTPAFRCPSLTPQLTNQGQNAMKVYMGSRGIAPFILNHGTRWKSVINLKPRPLFPQKDPAINSTAGLSGPLSWPGRLRRKEKSRQHAGIRTPDRPARSPYNIPTELPRFSTTHNDLTNEQTTLYYVLYHTFIGVRTELFWVITQRVVVIFIDVSGQPIGPHL